MEKTKETWKDQFNYTANKGLEYEQVGWGSKASQLSKFNVALKKVKLQPTDTILDVGCGNGVFEQMLKEKHPKPDGKICGVDISERQIEIAKKKVFNVIFTNGDMNRLPFLNDSFSVLYCIGVLQNFDGEIDEVLSEFRRVLVKGGKFFIVTMDSTCRDITNGKIKVNPSQRYFIPQLLKDRMDSKGLVVSEMRAISTKEPTGNILPLHHWHTFYLVGINT